MKKKIITQILAISALVLGLVGLFTYVATLHELDSYPVEIWALLPAFTIGFYVLGFMAVNGYPPDLDAPWKKLKELLRR